jgi:hypothetical protein
MRSSVNNANNTYNTATGNATQYGDQASGINGQLTPFLEQRLNNPQGYSQQDLGAMLANTLGSSGGATSGITGQANSTAARTRNDAGFGSALDAAARSRTQANAGAAEGIASNDAGVKLQQQSDAAKMLQGMYGTDVGAQQDAMNQQIGATNAATDASKTGWLQNAEGVTNSLSNAYSAYATCPTSGSLYLMADGTERPVESVEVGDLVLGIDDEPQEVKKIETSEASTVRVHTENGFITHNSTSHEFILPKGGFALATQCEGKEILTKSGASKVVRVEPCEKEIVYSIITDGSHTYCADGVWSLGVAIESVVNA